VRISSIVCQNQVSVDKRVVLTGRGNPACSRWGGRRAGSGILIDKPAFTAAQLPLLVLDGRFAICRLGNDAPVPSWATMGSFFSITRTAEELSVVCQEQAVPEGVSSEKGWRCLRVAGTIPFSVVGVLASAGSCS
jgi:hypothetical protein